MSLSGGEKPLAHAVAILINLAVRVTRSEQSLGKADHFGNVLGAARRRAEASVQQRTLLAGQKLIDVNDVFARVRARIGSMSREARYNRT
jgi:hypothetical protein